jgi:hypothetical protein
MGIKVPYRTRTYAVTLTQRALSSRELEVYDLSEKVGSASGVNYVGRQGSAGIRVEFAGPIGELRARLGFEPEDVRIRCLS